MIKRTLGCVALFGWLVAATGTLQAHHSLAGVYDMKAEKQMQGTVSSIKFTNPHGSLSISVKNKETTVETTTITHQYKRPFAAHSVSYSPGAKIAGFLPILCWFRS